MGQGIRMGATRSVDTRSPREAYEQGMPLHVLRRRFHLSDSEAQDVAPEEFGDQVGPEGVGGY